TIMAHPNKRKKQLKAARAKKHHEIDERASDYFAVLLTASRPSTYIGGSKRIQRCKKAKLRKAAQNTRSITTYLAPALTTSTLESSTESIEMESIEMESIGVESAKMELIEVESTADLSAEIDLDERTKMRLAIEELERTLKKDDNQMDKGVRAQNWIKWQKLPKENCDKFTKVSSLLDDERISMKVLKEKKLYVRKRHGDGLKNWASIKLEPVLVEYNDKDLSKLVEKNISPKQKRHCEHKIHPKGQGRGIHVSKFLCEPLGRVHLTEEQHAAYPEIPK
ncbi:29511_t:CDS:2, partial [Racocetra persica]